MSSPTPIQVTEWLRKHYPRPIIAPVWLNECYNWVVATHSLSLQMDLPLILEHVDMQFLNSDLRDSALPGTGLPTDISTWQKRNLGKTGVLVEVAAMTEIGHSAFDLLQTREKRIDSESVRGLEGDEDAEDGAGMPKYPRSMLRFELTDGSITIPAIEYRSLPQLELGITPLGYKMVLRGTLIREGTAFLSPETAIMKGGKNDDRDQYRDADLVRGWNMQLNRQDPNPPPVQEEDGNENDENTQPSVQHPSASSRAPLRELSEIPAVSTAYNHGRSHEDDENLPRRRKVPPSVSEALSVPTTSHYFPAASASPAAAMSQLAEERLLSPTRRGPLVVEQAQQDNDENFSELDDDLYMDDVFLEEVKRFERAAIAGQSQERDVIVIASDSDQGDKENVPVSQRRVRRRTGDFGTPGREGVIEIVSDSD